MAKRTIDERLDDLKHDVYELPASEPLLDALIELVCIVSKMRAEQTEATKALGQEAKPCTS